MTGTRALSIAIQTDKPLAAYGPFAAEAERYGFDAVTAYNDLLYQPAWLPLLEMARATRRVRLGVAAVNPFTCHPLNIAGNIALVDEAALLQALKDGPAFAVEPAHVRPFFRYAGARHRGHVPAEARAFCYLDRRLMAETGNQSPVPSLSSSKPSHADSIVCASSERWLGSSASIISCAV